MPLQDKTNPEDSGLTSAILGHLALHGAKPGPDETDHRPLPQSDQVELAIATFFDTTVSLLDDSQLEDNLEEMLWSAYSGVIRPPVPIVSGHPYRFDPAGDSGASGHPHFDTV